MNQLGTSLHGAIVSLRAPEPSDLDMMYLLENDPSCSQYTLTTSPISRQQLWNYLQNYSGDFHAERQLRLVIVNNATNEAIGAVDVTDYDPNDARAFVGIGIIPTWRGKGCGSEALRLLMPFCANILRLHQLAAIVAVDNNESMALFRNVGFKSSGRLRSWHRCGKSYVDAILLQHLFE